MLLLADNSNRTTKLACGDASGVRPDSLRRLPSAGLSMDALLAALDGIPACDGLAWCSVTDTGPAVLAALAGRLGLRPLPLCWNTVPLQFTGYPQPETIGPDRLANALAAAARFPGKSVLAIDAGTAITFNAVAPTPAGHPLFLGGAIAPGLAAFTGWLAGHTDRLPEISLPTPGCAVPAIGTSTLAAMQSAACHGLAGMVWEITRATLAELGAAEIIVTGSDAAIIAAILGPAVTCDPVLTLDGVRIAGFHAQS
jgi:type III pantothenate kinase